METPIRFRDDPPPLPEGYVLTGPTAHWQSTLNRVAWYVQRRMGLEKRYPAHTFSTMFSLAFLVAGAVLIYATPATSGWVHWLLLALFFPIVPPALWIGLTVMGVFHEKPNP